MDAIEFRRQDNALLFIWIRAGDDSYAALGCAEIIGQMRYAGGNVDKISGLSGEDVLRVSRQTTCRIRRLKYGWLTRDHHACAPPGSYTWRDGHYLQMDRFHTYRFGGYPVRGQVPLLAYELRT